MVAIGDQRLVTDEAVRERDEGGEVAQGGLRIQASDLERPERGGWSHVPPDRAGVRSLGDAAELRRRLRVVLPVAERSRQAGARDAVAHHDEASRETRVLPVKERGIRGPCLQKRTPLAYPV